MQMYASVKPPKTYWEFSEAVLSLHSNQVHQRLPWNKQRNNGEGELLTFMLST